jgi:hypothetical protein
MTNNEHRQFITQSKGKSNRALKLLSMPTRLELHESMGKAPQAVPPPKYKLFLIIWFCVLTLNLVNVLAGGQRELMGYGLAFSAATFIGLCHQMVVIIYALAPCMLSCYLLERWIKAPRCKVEEMTPIYSILDQGLQIFAAPPKEKPPQEIMNRLDRLEGTFSNSVSLNAIRTQCL